MGFHIHNSRYGFASEFLGITKRGRLSEIFCSLLPSLITDFLYKPLLMRKWSLKKFKFLVHHCEAMDK